MNKPKTIVHCRVQTSGCVWHSNFSTLIDIMWIHLHRVWSEGILYLQITRADKMNAGLAIYVFGPLYLAESDSTF